MDEKSPVLEFNERSFPNTKDINDIQVSRKLIQDHFQGVYPFFFGLCSDDCDKVFGVAVHPIWIQGHLRSILQELVNNVQHTEVIAIQKAARRQF